MGWVGEGNAKVTNLIFVSFKLLIIKCKKSVTDIYAKHS